MQIIATTPITKVTTASLSQFNKHTKSSHTRRNHKTVSLSSSRRSSSDTVSSTSKSKTDNVFEIVYAAPSDIITPPPSPKSSPSAASFAANDRILTARRQGHLKYLMAEYNALKKEGLMLHDHTYNLVFESYAALRRDGTPLVSMLKIFDEMIESGIQPSSSTYSILIRALCKRDVEVQKVIAMLKRQNARSCSKSSSSNMAELESEGNITKALSIFDAAVGQDLVQFFEPELYNQILRVLSHYGNTEASLYVYEQLNLHAGPTSATFAALINLFGRVGNLPSALKYFERYCELKDTFGHHDASYIYNALVDAHLKCNQLEGAMKIVKNDMLNCNVKMSTIPFNSIIRYYCIHNRMDEAIELIESMKQSSPEPDASSFGPILSTYCQLDAYDEASKVYKDLIKTDISKSYGNLANYALLCLKHESTNVFQVLDDMRSAGLEPDPSLAARIITHFANASDITQALRSLRITLEATKPRTLAKGFYHIESASLAIATAAETRFAQVFEVSRALYPYCPQGLPSSIAKVLVNSYKGDNDHSMLLQQSDYSILFDASFSVSSESFQSIVFDLYAEMIEKGIRVTSVLKARVFSHLQALGDRKAMKKWNSLFVVRSDEQAQSVEAEEASQAVMKAAVHGQLQEALDILRTRIAEPGLVPSVESLRDAIAFIGKQGHLDIAVAMYRLCIKSLKTCNMESQQLSKAIYSMTNSILIGYAQQGDMLNAKKYYEQIKLMGRYPDGNGYASLLLGSAKCATDEATDALLIYDEAKRHDVKPTTFFYNVVISKLAKARKLDSAMKLFEEMQQFSIVPNSITYGAQEALDILRTRIAEPGLVPSVESLRDAIAFIGKQGHLDIAVAMYRLCIKSLKTCNMESQQLSKAIYSMTNSILIGYAQQGDMLNAKKYYEQIKLMGRYPDGNGYASLLLGSAKCATDEATDALLIYDEAKRHDVKPTTFFYNVVISKLAKARKLDSAMKLFEEMQQFSIVPNSITYGAIISACVRAGSESLACKLFNDMLASSSFQPRVGPFNNMIQFYVRQQPNRERALHYFAELRRRHIKPSPHTYKLLMEAYCMIAPYDMTTAHRMLSEMERRDNIRPQATHYAALIYSYGVLQRDVKSASLLFKDMEEKRIAKDEVVYQAMLDTLVSNDRLAEAEELYAMMKQTIQRSSSPYIENVFIRGYGQKGLLEKAKAMFDAMSDDKDSDHDFVVIREPSTYEAMVRAYVENEKKEQAKAIFDLMLQREFPEKVTASVAELVSA
ncbi:hypothetical protein RMCBS344292_12995 [Rhizopus microsporus]|nr:hypothetical protein RMCBS344292_12995 [Rhizopus microsporus]